MVMAMINIKALRRSILVIVLEKDNLDRMAKGDPVTVESTLRGGLMTPPMFPMDYSVLISTELDQAELYKRAKGNGAEFLDWLERGRVFIKGVDGTENASRLKSE